MKKSEEFISAIRHQIIYWDQQNRSSFEKMEGLAFSILCMLDGVSGSFDGTIKELEKDSRGIMIHDLFYKKEPKAYG